MLPFLRPHGEKRCNAKKNSNDDGIFLNGPVRNFTISSQHPIPPKGLRT